MFNHPTRAFDSDREAGCINLAPNGPGARFQGAFDRQPAILGCANFTSEDDAFHRMEAVLEAGYQGVFLLLDHLDAPEPRRCMRRFASTRRNAWIGARVSEAMSFEDLNLVPGEIQGLWLPDMEPSTAEPTTSRIRAEDWDCLLFGGLKLADDDSDDVVASAVLLSRFVDVVVVEPPVPHPAQIWRQVRAIKHALGNFPLAIADRYFSNSIRDLTGLADCLIAPAHPAPVAPLAGRGC